MVEQSAHRVRGRKSRAFWWILAAMVANFGIAWFQVTAVGSGGLPYDYSAYFSSDSGRVISCATLALAYAIVEMAVVVALWTTLLLGAWAWGLIGGPGAAWLKRWLLSPLE